MPIYTYQCESCGITFERQQKFDDDPITECPECEAQKVHRVYKPVGIVFKGSGFYATDHHSPSGKTNTPEKSGDVAAASPKKTKKEKPAPKKEPKEVNSQ